MNRIKTFFSEYRMILVLAAIFIAISSWSPFFLKANNLINVLVQASTYGIMACGMSFVIISGEFDLSIGSTLSMSGLIAILLEPALGQIPAILVALVAGTLVGVINGLLIAKAKISSFIVTIGTMSIFKGVALKISSGNPIISENPWFGQMGNGAILGAPNLVLVLIIFILVSSFVLYRTRFGRNLYAVGGSMEVARNSGIHVVAHKIIAFAINAFTAAVAGVLLASRLNSGSALYGDNAALSVISGVVIGGTSLSGGVGNIAKSIIGILIFTLITNSLDLLRVFSYYQTAIRGLLLIIIIGMDAYTANRALQIRA